MRMLHGPFALASHLADDGPRSLDEYDNVRGVLVDTMANENRRVVMCCRESISSDNCQTLFAILITARRYSPP
jgi:hypothetical protein